MKKIEDSTYLFVLDNSDDFNAFKSLSPRSSESPWYKICVNAFGIYEFQKAMLIKQRWDRNSKNFREKILLKIESQSPETGSQVGLSANKHSIRLRRDEWLRLKSISLIKSGTEFNQKFHYYLSYKLQLSGLNCWLKCKYNRISKKHSISSNKTYWKGIYTCKKPCHLNLNCFIEKDILSEADITINAYWSGNNNHPKIDPPIRCVGSLRETIGKEIFVKGLANIKAENIFENLSKKKVIFFNYHLEDFLQSC